MTMRNRDYPAIPTKSIQFSGLTKREAAAMAAMQGVLASLDAGDPWARRGCHRQGRPNRRRAGERRRMKISIANVMSVKVTPLASSARRDADYPYYRDIEIETGSGDILVISLEGWTYEALILTPKPKGTPCPT